MNKKGLPIRLSTQFTIVALVAMIISILLFLIILACGSRIIETKVENSDYIEQNLLKKVNEFQKYITDNNISTDDVDLIFDWVKKERNVMLSIHDNDRVIFDSTMAWRKKHRGENTPPPHSYRTQYDIQFADKTAFVELFVLLEFKYIVAIHYLAIFVAFLTFILLNTSFIRRKVKYVTMLEQEVNILEGGDLGYKLTIKGNDELAYLASSIDKMRTSIIERQQEEEKARLANHKLVTAMSHDLRTPLTILIGLLEIIDNKKYTTESELDTYVSKTKNKAYRIKELSDKIFEYFFAFDIKESELNKEPYKTEVINTMIEDYIFSLGEKGFTFEYECCEQQATVMLDTKVFARVLSNIFSNILKYADKTKPVVIKGSIKNDMFTVMVSNAVIKKEHKEESTNIGLEVCKNITQQHNGSFEHIEDEQNALFTVTVKLPVLK